MAHAKTRRLGGVKLKLSEDEAQFLADVLAHIGGNEMYSRRGYAVGIAMTLEEVGYFYDAEYGVLDTKGSIYFKSKGE